ncbi:MAG: hypothetical protein R2873_19055 [Caldilineaceae bacterium]
MDAGISLFAQSPAPTPAPTAEPASSAKPAVRTEITFPTSDTVAYGIMRETALINNYLRYEVHLAPSNSSQWTWLSGDFKVVRDGIWPSSTPPSIQMDSTICACAR